MTSQRTERKVITVLFADLVGFTQRSEQLDPRTWRLDDRSAGATRYIREAEEPVERTA
jgi:class 3 adenylate cyclase